jgi:hypothetical protein
MDINAVIEKVMRLARLDTTVFDDVRDDQQELIPALIVAAVSFLLAGIGAWLFYFVVADSGYREFYDGNFVNNALLGSIFAIVLYGVAALAVYVVLAQMYRVTVDLQALVRTMGYAAAPMALSVLMFIPIVWPLFAIVPLALLLLTMNAAVRSASGAEENHAMMATIIGFSVMVVVLGLISLSSGSGDFSMGAGLFGVLADYS